MSFDVTDTDTETAYGMLMALSEIVGNRLRSDGVKIQVVSAGIRYSDLSYYSYQKVLDNPTDLNVEICSAAKKLFSKLWNGRPIRPPRGAYKQSKYRGFRQAVGIPW